MPLEQTPKRQEKWGREAFVRFIPVPTRWADNDAFGHVNNVQYYAYFDTAITRTEIEGGIFDLTTSAAIPYVVQSICTYFKGVAFPDDLDVGLAVSRIGNSSIAYRLAVFKLGQAEPAAQGEFIHVYVDRVTEKPVPLPEHIRQYAERLMVKPLI